MLDVDDVVICCLIACYRPCGVTFLFIASCLLEDERSLSVGNLLIPQFTLDLAHFEEDFVVICFSSSGYVLK